MPQLSTIIDLLSHFKPFALVSSGTVSQPSNTLVLGQESGEFKIIDLNLLRQFDQESQTQIVRASNPAYKGMETLISEDDVSASRLLTNFFNKISQPDIAIGQYDCNPIPSFINDDILIALYQLDTTGDESQWHWVRTPHAPLKMAYFT